MTPQQFNAFLNDLAAQCQPIAIKTCDRVATTFKNNVSRDCPVDTGHMKTQIIKQPLGTDKIRVYVNTDYAVPVDKGHRTRLGTGIGPPKPGGIAFVPANPFFSKHKDKIVSDKTLAKEFRTDIIDFMRRRVSR